MSADFKPRSQAAVRILKFIGIVGAILGGVAFVVYGLALTVAWLQTDAPPTTVVTPTAPPTSSSASSEPQNERIPEGDLLKGLSGEYTGSINFPEGEMQGAATLEISEDRFRLRSNEKGRQLSGKLEAKNMGDYVDLRLIFATLNPVTTKANYIPAQLPRLSLRATLPSDGAGWQIKNAPDEDHQVVFFSQNCPRPPYCKPVRRCRPCDDR